MYKNDRYLLHYNQSEKRYRCNRIYSYYTIKIDLGYLFAEEQHPSRKQIWDII